jgi:WD40 repeat protein
MVYCLNPHCSKPENPDHHKFCHDCGIPLVYLLKDRYKILKILGQGGFGRTFLAEDQDKLNEKCVVKQLVPENQGTGAIAKVKQLFEEEAKRLQQLGNHPQIPSLLAYFEADNRLYLVQEWIDGEDLEQELQNHGVFNEDKIRDLLNQILSILEIVHQQNVIHRDIKPVNIMRRKSNQQFILIDFGVAKHQTASAMQKTGTAIGSQGYAAIEQLQDRDAFPSSDLFSLGATCFHLLTGIHPYHLFLDEGYSWVRNWRNHLNQPINKNLEEVLDNLLQKDHLKRYQSARDVITALNYTPPPPTQYQPSQPQPIHQPQQQQQTHTQLQLQPKPSSLPQSLQQPIPQTIPQYQQPLNKKIYQNPPNKNLLLIIGILVFLSLGGYTISQFYTPKNTAFNPTKTSEPISTKPKNINDENFTLINTLTGHSNSVNSLQFSPDGKTLASGSSDNTIKIWDVNTGNLKTTLTGHSDIVVSVQFSPVGFSLPSGIGQYLASGSWDSTIKIWDVNTGNLKTTLTGHSSGVTSVQFSPVGVSLPSGIGQSLASGSYDQTIKIWDVKTGNLKATLTGHSNNVNSVQFSPDGKTLASGSWDQTIKIWDVKTKNLKATLTGHYNSVNSVQFSPDGQYLASGSKDDTIKIWDVKTGNLKATLTGHSNSVQSVAFSPDGQTLASGSSDYTIKIWDVKTGNMKATLTGHSYGVNSVQFSPDGQTLASGSADKTIKLWRVK